MFGGLLGRFDNRLRANPQSWIKAEQVGAVDGESAGRTTALPLLIGTIGFGHLTGVAEFFGLLATF
jgi:hypothetical protein